MWRHVLGLHMGLLEWHSAFGDSDQEISRLCLRRWMVGQPGVCAVPTEQMLTPWIFRATQRLETHQSGWLASPLLSLQRHLFEAPPAGTLNVVAAVLGRTSLIARAEIREALIEAGYAESPRTVDQAAALARYALGGIESAGTALIVLPDLEGTELTVVTVLKNAVRLHGSLFLPFFSQSLIAETILAWLLDQIGHFAPNELEDADACWPDLSLQWLHCAHCHDQGDRRIHWMLADAYCRQAETFAAAADFAAALCCAERSLEFNPDQEELQCAQAAWRDRC